MMTCTPICLDDDLQVFLDRAFALGQRDYHDRIDVMDGWRKFQLAGANEQELEAYARGWSHAQLRSILKTAKVDYQEIG